MSFILILWMASRLLIDGISDEKRIFVIYEGLVV